MEFTILSCSDCITISVSPWTVISRDAVPSTRNPIQVYEALLEGVVLFVVLYIMVRRGALERTGLVSVAFMIGYGIVRIVAVFFREPDPFLSFVLPGTTMGQLLSLPMVLVGIGLTLDRKSTRLNSRH